MNQAEKNIIQEHVADNYQRLREKLEAELKIGKETIDATFAKNSKFDPTVGGKISEISALGLALLAIEENVKELQALENKARSNIKKIDEKGIHPSIVDWVKANDIAGTGYSFRNRKALQYVREFCYENIPEADRPAIYEQFQFLERYWNRPKSVTRLKAHLESFGITIEEQRREMRAGKHFMIIYLKDKETTMAAEDYLDRLGWKMTWTALDMELGRLNVLVSPAGLEKEAHG